MGSINGFITTNDYDDGGGGGMYIAYGKIVEYIYKIVQQYIQTQKCKGKRKKDIDNYTFPVHKFLMDALVEHEVIADDSYDYVRGFTTSFGDDDMEDSYVVIELNGDEL